MDHMQRTKHTRITYAKSADPTGLAPTNNVGGRHCVKQSACVTYQRNAGLEWIWEIDDEIQQLNENMSVLHNAH